MKNYKISLLDDKELIKKYSRDTSPIIEFYSTEELILNLYDTKEKNCNISYKLHEQEILLVAQNNDYITPDGYLYDARSISMLDGNYLEDVDEEGVIHYTDTTVTDKRELEKEVSKINDLTYLSDKDTEIYLNIKTEELYTILTNLGLDVTGFSGYEDPIRPIDLANSIHKIFSFNIHIPSKKIFIQKATELLESEIDIKGYTIAKSKEGVLDKVKKLDEKYGTNGKGVLVINDKKYEYFKHTLILLHLEEKIQIAKYDSSNKEFEVSILTSKEILAKEYTIKDNLLIINDGDAKIALGNLEKLILSKIENSYNTVYFSDFEKNSKNPEAVVKKIRAKVKENGILDFQIKTKRHRYNGDTEISIHIGA